jgi:hypothetical protein
VKQEAFAALPLAEYEILRQALRGAFDDGDPQDSPSQVEQQAFAALHLAQGLKASIASCFLLSRETPLAKPFEFTL